LSAQGRKEEYFVIE
jgi:hypothetical protein